MKFNIDEKIKANLASIKKLVFGEEAPVDLKMTEAKLTDGTVIQYEGETPVAGAKVMIAGAPAPDGSLQLEDGTVIEVAGGVIMDVKIKEEEKAATPPAPAESSMAKEYQELLEKFEANKKEFEKSVSELKKEVSEAKEINKEIFSLIEQMANIPDGTPAVKPKSAFNKKEVTSAKIALLSENLKKIKTKI